MSKIKCMVEECHYNDTCICNADEIEVCSCGSNNVKCDDQTKCHTFREKSGIS